MPQAYIGGGSTQAPTTNIDATARAQIAQVLAQPGAAVVPQGETLAAGSTWFNPNPEGGDNIAVPGTISAASMESAGFRKSLDLLVDKTAVNPATGGSVYRRFNKPEDIQYWHAGGSDYSTAFNLAFEQGQNYLRDKRGEKFTLEAPIDTDNVAETRPFMLDFPHSELAYEASAGLFFANTFSNLKINLMKIRAMAGAGHIFNQPGLMRSGHIKVNNVDTSASPYASFLFGRDAALVGGRNVTTQVYKITFDINYYVSATTGNNPQPGASFFDVKMIGDQYRGNKIFLGFAYGASDNPIISIACASQAGSVNGRNLYEILLAESSAGGLAHLAGEIKPTIRAYSYDMAQSNDDAIVLDRITAAEMEAINGVNPGTYTVDGRKCIGATVEGNRQGGTMSPHYDLNIKEADETEFDLPGHNSGLSTSRINVNFNSARGRNTKYALVENVNESYVNQDADGDSGVIDPDLGATISIVNGTVVIPATATHPVLQRKIDTEGSVPLDSFNEIVGGFAGQRLIASSAISGRDIDVVNSSVLKLNGELTFNLNRDKDIMMFYCQSPGNWIELHRSSSLD